jgi:hypothetical protein
MIRRETRKLGLTGALFLTSFADGDYRAMVPLGLWGAAAAACLLLLAFATWTETGQARLTGAYASLQGRTETQDAGAAERARQLEDARKTAETIRNLTRDRNDLLVRITALERNYEDVTGSIGKLAHAVQPRSATASVAVDASQSPIDASGIHLDSGRDEVAIDIGGATSVAAMSATWDRIRRKHATLLDGLRPLITVRDGRGGQIELRLVAGPLSNRAAAAKLCAPLAATGIHCEPAAFEGQRLVQR